MRSEDHVTNPAQARLFRQLVAVAPILLTASLAGLCQRAPSAPNEPWLPDHRTLEHHTIVVPTHEIVLADEHIYSLGELIDIAESNNPTTQGAWNRARIAAATVGITKSELYPTIIAAEAGRAYLNPELFGATFAVQDFGTFSTGVYLSYTLLDFGARRTEISATQARLITANLSFNNEHLLLIQKVSESYFNLLEAKGLREAAEVSFNDAKTSEAAAQDRRKNGLATVPEVLEAKAATARANYQLQSALGTEQDEIGELAKAITANPLRPLNVEPLDQLKIPDELDQSVQRAIDAAFSTRPDLLADEARVRAAREEVRHAESSYYPSITFEGSKGWLRAYGEQRGSLGVYAQTHTYEATLGLKWTIFDGLLREKRVTQAKAEEELAKNEVHERQDEITDEVWTEYSNAKTALRQRDAATALLIASRESYSAALESYREGVRNFLDVLAAENALAQARAIDVTARTQVLRTFTDLDFRTGDLLANHPKGKTP